MIMLSDAANCTLVCSCRHAGNTSMIRSMAWGASFVCSVAKHEVASLGHGQRYLDRINVAHLTNEQDVRVLAQR